MKIYSDIDAAYDPLDGCVLAVGNFDGVHRGHQLIFNTAVRRARDEGLKAVLLTFSRHPASVIRPDETPESLMTVRDRLLIAESFGFDTAFILDFDPQMATLSPGKFVEDVLVNRLGIRAVVAGENWRFGHRREGDMPMLSSLGILQGFEVDAVDPFMVDDLPVSSTRIRGALSAGDVAAARTLLGRPHFVRGTVVSGEGRGRNLGFPTVNLDCHQILVPEEGVYAGGYQTAGSSGEVGSGSEKFGKATERIMGPAAISIGSSPTFEKGSFSVEAHLIGWEEDLYGGTVTIAFYDRLREQRSYSSAGDLVDQIALDVEKSRDLYSIHELDEIPL
ncbi:MAG: bifunctional riboflavin kinase/FAD synthetase [bacterium]|nr:bifunctional riboflavin kinase/FAD synthetase [bacterium]MDT8365622.1 bifunctional riboflavin kinase/FAD synthetase [bacterium]